jgi:serine/threonine-protein kinase
VADREDAHVDYRCTGVEDQVPHPLLDVGRVDEPLERHLRRAGRVFVTIRGHDSRNTSYGIAIAGERWFVKHGQDPEAVRLLESAVRFHRTVRHPAIVPLRARIETPDGLAVVHEWRDGEVLNDPLAPGALPREHPRSAFSRFRALPVREVLEALDAILDAHLAVAARGFVAVDLYDGAILYDFARRRVHLCDLDAYRPGPYVLDRDRQYGSTRFMAPEEFRRGALVDERTTVFALGRTAFVLLGDGLRGEPEPWRWRAGPALHRVAVRATAPAPEDRHGSVADLAAAWRAAAGR